VSKRLILLVVFGLVILALLLIPSYLNRNHAADGSLDLEDPAIGPTDAKVTIVEYGDFGCPTCRGWEKAGVRDQVLSAYGKQVRFVWRNFPIITAQSPKAAEAGHCANEQGKFWDYHHLLYQMASNLSVADLKSYAKQIGLDEQQFNQCLDSGKYSATVQQEIKAGYQLGFIGTPSFLINDQKLVGPASFAEFKARIDTILR
jgi:protein-disulfide isomerase